MIRFPAVVLISSALLIEWSAPVHAQVAAAAPLPKVCQRDSPDGPRSYGRSYGMKNPAQMMREDVRQMERLDVLVATQEPVLRRCVSDSMECSCRLGSSADGLSVSCAPREGNIANFVAGKSFPIDHALIESQAFRLEKETSGRFVLVDLCMKGRLASWLAEDEPIAGPWLSYMITMRVDQFRGERRAAEARGKLNRMTEQLQR